MRKDLSPRDIDKLNATEKVQDLAREVSKLKREIIGVTLDTDADRDAFLCRVQDRIHSTVLSWAHPRMRFELPQFDLRRLPEGVWVLIPCNEQAVYLLAVVEIMELYNDVDPE